MKPGRYDFVIDQRTSWGKTFYFGNPSIGPTLTPSLNPLASIVVDGLGKTFTRNDGGSWLVDGFAIGNYLVCGGFQNDVNNGSHLTTTATDLVMTCAGDTMVSETASPGITGQSIMVLKALDFTGATGASMIRQQYNSPTPAATITVAFPTPANGGIALSLTNIQTAAITAGPTVCSSASQYVWDLIVTQSALVIRYLQGKVSIDPGATY